MKTFNLFQILSNLVVNDAQEDWHRMYELCRDYVGETARGARKERIYHVSWEHVESAYLHGRYSLDTIRRVFDALRVDILDDGTMLACHVGRGDSYSSDMRVLRDLFD